MREIVFVSSFVSHVDTWRDFNLDCRLMACASVLLTLIIFS